MKKGKLIRTLFKYEYPQLTRTHSIGETVYLYDGDTFGCCGDGYPITFNAYGALPFYEVPKWFVEWEDE